MSAGGGQRYSQQTRIHLPDSLFSRVTRRWSDAVQRWLLYLGCELLDRSGREGLSHSLCVLIADVSDPEQTRHLPDQPGLLLGKRKEMEKMRTGESKWKHLTLRLKTDTGTEYGSMLCVTYHAPLLPSAHNTLTML